MIRFCLLYWFLVGLRFAKLLRTNYTARCRFAFFANSMRLGIQLLFIFFTTGLFAQQWIVTDKSSMPMRITNNAVSEGMVNGTKYVYSFGGLDSTKIYSGITLKSFRYNTLTDIWDTILSLPDTLGKIASAASTLKNKIYIIGGYHVLANNNEISSGKVHIYNPENNNYLPDGANIPVPIDDHVQSVWRDSLIYVITGWSNTTNVPNVQIYNPFTNSWLSGTNVPNNNTYKAFGASGKIVGDTIYYYGGASTSFNFPAQTSLRKGVIDPSSPVSITWSNPVSFTGYPGYRMAATSDSLGNVCFIGGSSLTYNYNGIAYNGSGGVKPNNRNLYYSTISGLWNIDSTQQYPMDLRGIADGNSTVKYIAGGMIAGQEVSNKTLMLTFQHTSAINETFMPSTSFYTYPNPANTHFFIVVNEKIGKTSIEIELRSILGELMYSGKMENKEFKVNCSGSPNGVYFIRLTQDKSILVQKLMIFH